MLIDRFVRLVCRIPAARLLVLTTTLFVPVAASAQMSPLWSSPVTPLGSLLAIGTSSGHSIFLFGDQACVTQADALLSLFVVDGLSGAVWSYQVTNGSCDAAQGRAVMKLSPNGPRFVDVNADGNDDLVFVEYVGSYPQRVLRAYTSAMLLGVPPVAPATATAAPIRLDVAPNPSSDRVDLSLWLPGAETATVEVIDVQGRKVATLLDRSLPAGHHELSWFAPAPGEYFVRARVSRGADVRKLIVIR